MARHRNIRGLNYEEEYNDVYDEYSRSVEEESCISPRTARQYLYGDDDVVKSLEKVEEEEGYGDNRNDDEGDEGEEDSTDPSLIDAKTYSCLEAIQDVVGETIPEEVIIATIKKCKYDSEKALDVLLNRSTSHNTTTTKKSSQPQPSQKAQQIPPPQGLARPREQQQQLPPQLQQQQQQSPQSKDSEERLMSSSTSSERQSSQPSKLFLALANTQQPRPPPLQQSSNSSVEKGVDFEVYNFRKFIRDFLTRSLVLYERSQRGDKSKTAVAKSGAGAPVRNNSKGDLTKLNNTGESKSSGSKKSTSSSGNSLLEPPPSSKPSNLTAETNPTTITPTSSGTSSPYSTPKLISRQSGQHLKQMTTPKPPADILELYGRKRVAPGQRLNLNLVIVGHVDAGKSTIMGHLLALLGEVPKKTLHRNEVDARKAGKASFSFAWLLDETEEERSRGITIDVGQQRFTTERRAVTILDAPGHRDFIPNMIAGATKADVALLVIDATKGEFETGFEAGGQTAEHTVLLRSLGVSQLAVVVNKLDNVGFSEERYREIVDRLKKFLKAVGFKTDGDSAAVHFVPVSGLTGDNLVTASKEAAFGWYSGGPTLVQIIDGFTPHERPVTKPFRLAVNDIFKGQTSGVCVAGKVDSGFVEVGQRLLIRPANELVTVKNIFLNEDSSGNGSSLITASEAFAGDVLTLNLTLPAEGSAADQLAIGSVLCDLTSPPAALATRFEARIVLFSHLETSNATVVTPPLTKGTSVLLYSVCLNSEVARISKLVALLDGKSNAVLKRSPRLLSKGASALVEFTTTRPCVVEPYAAFKEYGRLIFRAGNQSLGAGIVTKIIA